MNDRWEATSAASMRHSVQVVLIVGLLLAVAACGSPEELATSQPGDLLPRVSVPSRFVGVVPGFSVVASSETTLLGGGGMTLGEDQSAQYPREVELVSLESGRVEDVPVPEQDEGYFIPSTAVSVGGDFFFLGDLCQDQEVSDDQGCQTATPASFRLRMADKSWEQLELPGVEGRVTGGGDMWVGPDGPVARLDASIDQGESRDMRRAPVYAVLEGTSWKPIGVGGAGVPSACVSGDRILVVERTTDDPEENGEGVTTFQGFQIPLDGSGVQKLPLPDLPSTFGGVSTNLGCAGDLGVLTGTQMGQPPQAFLLRPGSGWVEFSELLPEAPSSVATDMVSGPKGLLLRGWSPGGTGQMLAVDGDGSVQEVSGVPLGSELFWAGESGWAVSIGRPSDTKPEGSGSEKSDGPAAITVEVFS